MLKRLILSAITIVSLVQAQQGVSSSYFAGNANFYYISRLDNGDIINMPYRMLVEALMKIATGTLGRKFSHEVESKREQKKIIAGRQLLWLVW